MGLFALLDRSRYGTGLTAYTKDSREYPANVECIDINVP